jgi:hypothetical protein
MVDSRDKGSRAETLIKDKLKALTGLGWQRTPGSGALDPKHLLKGDLYVPGVTNVFCVECKHYKEDHLTSEILTSKNPTIIDWWSQAVRQAVQVNKKPLLLFKHDRSKIFVGFEDFPDVDYNFVYISRDPHQFFVSILEDWITHTNPKFVT